MSTQEAPLRGGLPFPGGDLKQPAEVELAAHRVMDDAVDRRRLLITISELVSSHEVQAHLVGEDPTFQGDSIMTVVGVLDEVVESSEDPSGLEDDLVIAEYVTTPVELTERLISLIWGEVWATAKDGEVCHGPGAPEDTARNSREVDGVDDERVHDLVVAVARRVRRIDRAGDFKARVDIVDDSRALDASAPLAEGIIQTVRVRVVHRVQRRSQLQELAEVREPDVAGVARVKRLVDSEPEVRYLVPASAVLRPRPERAPSPSD